MTSMLITVAEVDPFAATAVRIGLADDEREALIVFFANNRKAGDFIPGTGGLRKLRWPGRGKGKRGGYWIIYCYFNEEILLYVLAIYAKNQQIDLTPQQKEKLSALAQELKSMARRRRREGHNERHWR